MKKLLKFILAVAIIALICLLCYAGKVYKDDSNSKQVVNKKTENQTVSNQTVKNEVTNNTVPENKTQPIENNNQSNTVKEENNVSDEEKAIELAKKEFGDAEGVYFRIEQVESNGVYIVSARDSETTRNLAWYKVDVNNGTVE